MNHSFTNLQQGYENKYEVPSILTKRLFADEIAISKIGTQTGNEYGVFHVTTKNKFIYT